MEHDNWLSARHDMQILRCVGTDGEQVSELEFRLAPGGGCAFHFHKQFTKTLIPVEGSLAYSRKGKLIQLLRVGETMRIEPGTVHRYYNAGTGNIRFRVLIQPGHSGYEEGWKRWQEWVEHVNPKKTWHWRNIGQTMRMRAMKDMHWGGWRRLLNPIVVMYGRFS